MKDIVKARTILKIVPHIDAFCETAKKANQFRAIKSFDGMDDTRRIMERIIDQTFQADRLSNLKTVTLDRIDSMPKRQSEVLKLCYIQRQKVSAIAQYLGTTERTVFRIKRQGLENFARGLDRMGITDRVFRQIVRDNKWIRLIFLKQKI